MNKKQIITIALAGLAMGQWLPASKKSIKQELLPEIKLGREWRKNNKKERLAIIENAIKENAINDNRDKSKKKDPTHYIYLANAGIYDIPESRGISKPPLQKIFYASAKRGAYLFWEIATKSDIIAKDLDQIIDLVNFFLYTAASKTKKLALEDLAFSIETPQEITNNIDNFLHSYTDVVSNNKLMFQESSHKPWYSIHLRDSQYNPKRNLWLGYPSFKAFGILKDNTTIEIRPHGLLQGRPNNYQNKTNTISLEFDDLIATYLLLTHVDYTKIAPTHAVVMGAILSAPDINSENEDLRKKIQTLGNNLVKLLKKSKHPEYKDTLAPFFERLLQKKGLLQ